MLLLLLPTAFAHKPTFAEDCSSAEAACVVGDPEVSIVVYQPLTCEQDQLWLTYYAEAGFPLYLQLGVPEIDRLEDHRPSVALLHPGLPPVEELDEALPFEVPSDMGVRVFHAGEQGEFFEPFTQTASWVWVEETVSLPEK